MKKKLLLFAALSLIYFSVGNERGIDISSFELLITGSVEGKINIYNTFLNTVAMLIYISLLESSLSSRFRLRNYIAARGGFSKVLYSLMRASIVDIFLILGFKQLIYILFFFISSSLTSFYLYDMISTFLTLSLFSLLLIAMKLQGIRGSYAFFALASLNLLSQIVANKVPLLSTFIIGSVDWEKRTVFVYLCKSVSVFMMFYVVVKFSKTNKVLEVSDRND